MTSKTEQTTRRIAEIDAVQGNAGVGLTIGDVDDILTAVREHGTHAVARIADILAPAWRIADSRAAQNQVLGRAVVVLDAVREHDDRLRREG